MEFEEVDYWEEIGDHYELERPKRYLHHLSVLGCSGGTLSSLRTAKESPA